MHRGLVDVCLETVHIRLPDAETEITESEPDQRSMSKKGRNRDETT
jgi:hypothetical protein